jgi:hypothetical protein
MEIGDAIKMVEKQLKDLAKIAGNVEFNILSTEKIQKERLDICKVCENNKTTVKIDTCSLCGCFVATKVKFEKSQCPIGKW